MITLDRANPNKTEAVTTPLQTVTGWLKAIKAGKADPLRVIDECELGEAGFDYVLQKAYEQHGGYPLGV